ncbi:MAG: hypothetical protein RLZZ511_2756 [Cyanobacteriota bacterium]
MMKLTKARRSGLVVVALVGGTILGGCSNTPTQSNQKFVAVTQIVEHPSLNAVRDGLKESLTEAGFEPEKTLNPVRSSQSRPHPHKPPPKQQSRPP